MGKRVSDLFAKNGEVTKIIANDTSLKSSDIISTKPSFEGIELPKRVDSKGSAEKPYVLSSSPVKMLMNIIKKYSSIFTSPTSVLRLMTGDFQLDPTASAKVVKLPGFKEKDIAYNGLLSKMLGNGIIGNLVGSILDDKTTNWTSSAARSGAFVAGRYTLPTNIHPMDVLDILEAIVLKKHTERSPYRPNWKKIHTASNSPVGLKNLMQLSEGSKTRIGWRIPDNIISEVEDGKESSNRTRTVKFPELEFNKLISDVGIDGVPEQVTNFKESPDEFIYGNGNILLKDYRQWESYPYNVSEDFGMEIKSTIDRYSDRVNELKDAGLLSGYADWAGFEMGSDHQWKIEIYPYESAHVGTCTPELPVFFVPNVWGFKSKDLRLAKDTSIRITNGEEVDHLIAKGYPKSDVAYDYIAYSYSTCLPVISYDLSIGTVKTDSLKLFNGSTVEVFSGMNYNSILNMSILDDVYGSMRKYMNQYINACYDIETHSLAPYYNCAFEIVLKILRSGAQVKEAHHFIGVPVEYTPRLEGQQDPNEARIDITFGIIGYISPKVNLDSKWTTHDGRETKCKNSDLITPTPKWRDIMIKAGQYVPKKATK